MPRMTERDVNIQLDKELVDFTNSRYDGEVPAGFITIFADALFHSAPISHQIHTKSLRALLAKKESDLVVGEVGSMTKVLLNTPLDWIFTDLGQALDYLEDLEKVTIEHNTKLAEFRKYLDTKRKTLVDMIQPGGRNGMQVIQR